MGDCQDARTGAAAIMGDLGLAAPDLPVFAFGSPRETFVLVGAHAALRIRGRSCVRQTSAGADPAPQSGEAWAAIRDFVGAHEGCFIGGHLGFDLHAVCIPGAPMARYAATRLIVPELVLKVGRGGIFAASGRSPRRWRKLEITDPDRVSALVPPAVARLPEPSPAEQMEFQGRVRATLDWIGGREDARCTIARRVALDPDLDLAASFAASPDIGPHSRSFYLADRDLEFSGTSPELLIHGSVEKFRTFKLSGTYPRSPNPKTDAALARGFLRDRKIRDEHDLSANATLKALDTLGASVRLRRRALTLPGLRHLCSEFETRCGRDRDVTDVLRALLPAGTSPQDAGLRHILRSEPTARGAYYGLVGLVHPSGRLEFSQLLRAVFRHAGQTFAWAGAAISRGSDPRSELQETQTKLRSIAAVRRIFGWERIAA